MAPGRPELVGLLLLLQSCNTSNSLDRDRFEKRAVEKARKLLAEETEPPLTAA